MALDMGEDMADQRWVLDAGNHSERPTAIRAGLNVDLKHAFQSPHPVHRGGGLVVVYFAAGPVRHDAGAVFAVGCEHPVEASEVEARPGHQSSQSGNEIQWFQYHMSRTVTEGTLVLVDYPPLADGY